MSRVIIDDTALLDALAKMETARVEKREAVKALRAALDTPAEPQALQDYNAARERVGEAESVAAWEARFALSCGTPASESAS